MGIAAPGEAPDVFNLIPDYNEPARFLKLADDLAERGWPAARTEKLLGANFARLCADVWGRCSGAPFAAAAQQFGRHPHHRLFAAPQPRRGRAPLVDTPSPALDPPDPTGGGSRA